MTIRRLGPDDLDQVFDIFMERATWQGVPWIAHQWHSFNDGYSGATFYDMWRESYKSRLDQNTGDTWYGWGSFSDANPTKLLAFHFMGVWVKDGKKVATSAYNCATQKIKLPKSRPLWNDITWELNVYSQITHMDSLGIDTMYSVGTAANKKWMSIPVLDRTKYTFETVEVVKPGEYPKDEQLFINVMRIKFTTECVIRKITKINNGAP